MIRYSLIPCDGGYRIYDAVFCTETVDIYETRELAEADIDRLNAIDLNPIPSWAKSISRSLRRVSEASHVN